MLGKVEREVSEGWVLKNLKIERPSNLKGQSIVCHPLTTLFIAAAAPAANWIRRNLAGLLAQEGTLQFQNVALGLVNVLGDDLSVLGKFSEANRQANTYSSGPGVTLKSSLWPIEPKKNSKKYRLAAAGWNQSTNARCQIHGQLKSILWFF